MPMSIWHSFHMVPQSPWPLLISTHLFSVMVNFSFYLNSKFSNQALAMKLVLVVMMFFWWKDTLRENIMTGNHNNVVIRGLKVGMIMFILSEVLFFSSFFWSFFHFFLGPNIELGQSWPPIYVSAMNPVGTPLLNTVILLSSGVSITCAHNFLLKNDLIKTKGYLALTWALGIYFLGLQFAEYSNANFSIADSSYGSIFFMGTGFHGIHVLVGSIYLMFCSMVISKKWCNKKNLVSMDLSAWYWHFVDVVWIYLYLFMYWLPYV